MPYVMVPVPEEHVAAVMQFILSSIEKASIQDWDAESLTELWNDADEATRSLLAFAARAALSGDDLDVATAAQQVQLTPRDVTSIVNELAALAREARRASLVVLRTTTLKLANGRTTETRLVTIDPDVAKMVSAIERADLLDAAPPEAAQ